ncbi:MAG: ATP-binding cassette domain-containing protein [Acidimicrobiales bacterium]|nr:ATP-binding cassette domain-containing protein [Acidimicrobiales bacterium]
MRRRDAADPDDIAGAAPPAGAAPRPGAALPTDAAPLTDGYGESRPSDKETKREGPARLEIRDLVVSFGGLRAVDNVSATVEPGTIVGLIGPNGSGKTTLLDTISGLVPPTEGSLLLDGEDLGEYIPEERAELGVVRSFQDCRLYPELSVEDTLLLYEDSHRRVSVLATTLQLPWARRTERDKRRAVDRVIASFGLERFRYHLTGHLSTGTRRVVDLASIVLAGPRLLLLDEPTAGIAQREAEAFIPLLQRLQEVTGSTVLLVEHDVPLVFELCSTVIVMQTGTVVVSGSPDVVREDPRALAAYLGASDAALNVTGPTRAGTDAGPVAGSGPGTDAGSGAAV